MVNIIIKIYHMLKINYILKKKKKKKKEIIMLYIHINLLNI